MFVGGIDTTSTALEWLMAELIRSPNTMKRAQEEIRSIVGTKSQIDVDDINQMDYLKCIIKETMRLHPPLPLLVPRETSACVKLRPEEFLPERFKDSQLDFKGQDCEFIPFGGERRGCPGLTFGVASAEYVIANPLCWFDWRLPSANAQEADLDMNEVNALTVFKKTPLELVAIPYSP
uniref:Cytochrome P450 n=1 Tax=Fagus sylvatica TaxID=28930 RepID=A0A2N9IW34_FAGSY